MSQSTTAFSGQPSAVAGRLYAPRLDNPDGITLGTRVEFSDGRAFRFAQLRYTAGGGDFLTRADLLGPYHQLTITGNSKKQLPVWAGERVICINAGFGWSTPNQLAGGTIFMYDGLGGTVWTQHRILSHTTNDGSGDVFFTLVDPLPLTINPSTLASCDILPNQYMNLITMGHGTTASNPCMGVCMGNAGANKTGVPSLPIGGVTQPNVYFDWIQVAGPAYVYVEGAATTGAGVGVPAPTRNGAVSSMVDGTGAYRAGMQHVGYLLAPATDGNLSPIMITGLR